MVNTETQNSWGVNEQAPFLDTPRKIKIEQKLIPLALEAISASADSQSEGRPVSSKVVFIDRGAGEYVRISKITEEVLSRNNPGPRLVGIRIDRSEEPEDLEVIEKTRKAYLYFAPERGIRGPELFTENRLKVDDVSLDRVGLHLEAINRAILRGDLIVNQQNSPELFTQAVLPHQV